MRAGGKPLSSHEPVAITGLGAVCSLGNSVPEIARAFLSGKSGAGEIPGFDGCPAAPVKNLPPFKTDMPPQLARTMGKHLSLLLASVDEALRGASIGPGMFDPGDMGFFAGMGMVDYHVEDLLPAVLKSLKSDGDIDYDRFFVQGYREIYPLWSLGMLNNVAFCQASIHFGLRGENCVFCPHGDAGVTAVYEAAWALREGRAKMALAGGVSEEISPCGLARAKLKNVIGSIAETSARASFLGEAGAMLVLEPLSSAVARGASILGRIAGFGFSCERSDDGRFASKEAICSAMRAALCDAGLAPGGIDRVMLGSFDPNELDAVHAVFGKEGRPPVIVAAPRAVGETYAAGPVLHAVLALSISAGAAL
ncbi:MAG: beta-ketoacyl synthase N-terminal-like domain-containing protein, partial [Syntrophobacteraceae bacterium]|nr:beta-ketoacyl synthase N-terminal-like domain-containing protein [Syntrophobacteraceae bacterium]